MNKTDNTKQVRHGSLLLKCFDLPKPAQQRLNYQRHQHQNIKTIIIQTVLCFTVEQPLIHDMKLQAYFQVISRKYRVILL